MSHPTRSAILGLIAASLGIRRHEEERLQALEKSYLVAVRLDAPGDVLRDYHTTQVPPKQRKIRHYTRRDELKVNKLHTILSQRDYRTDAAATIALSTIDDPPLSLQQLADALRHPALPLYLGRKSCPLALPLAPKIVQTSDLKTAFNTYSPATEPLNKLTVNLHQYGQGIPAPDHMRFYWEEEETSPGFKSEMTYARRDRLRNRKRWQFNTRNEHYAAEDREK